jgi:putative tryptophan/tyrosine transport system substrate-binding protein
VDCRPQSAQDPIPSGIVASPSHPGVNIAGFTMGEFPLGGKMVEVLKEIAPQVSRVALLLNPNQPNHVAIWRSIKSVAPSFGVRLEPSHVKDPADIEPAIKAFVGEPNGGLIVIPSSIAGAHREQVVALAARHPLPAAYAFRAFVGSGGLVSYGIDTADLFRRAADYVNLILKGAKPADLPVQHPTKFDLVFNLKTAKALGLTVPASLLARADAVIE